MDQYFLKVPCNTMPFVCETDFSITWGSMVHADRTAPFHVAIYLLQGSMEIIEDGIPYRLMPEQLFFLKSGVRHWGEKPFEQGSSWYYAHFYCEQAGDEMEELPQDVYYDTKVCLDRKDNERYITVPKLTDCGETDRIRQNFEKMIEAHVHGNIPLASVRLWQIFLESMQNAREDAVGNRYVKQVREYIKKHYIEGFHSEEIERACGLSYKYAGTLFKEATGQTIKEYQSTLRLRRAEQLLTETDRPITEIAQMAGFSDIFYFSRIFSREKGCSPREYRKAYIPGI